MSATTQPFESAESRALIRERDEALRERDGVTICVPCYQQAEYLPDCLHSIYAQTVSPLEIIVVDDGTPDDSVGRVIDEILRLAPQVRPYTRCVRVTNRGLPGARNTGLMLAKGRAFVPLDADDWLDPTFIEKTTARMDEGDVDVVVTGLQEHGPRDGEYMPGWDRPLEEITEGILWMRNCLFYCALYNTDLLRSIGGWNGRMVFGWEDWTTWLDLYRRGARIGEVREPLFQYRTKEQSMLHEAERHRAWNMAEMRRHHLA